MMNEQFITFPIWKQALASERPPRHAELEREIVFFPHHCKRSHQPATVGRAKAYLEGRPGNMAREALRRYLREGRRRLAGGAAAAGGAAPDKSALRPAASCLARPSDLARKDVPAVAKSVLGASDQGRALVKSCRTAGPNI